MEFKDNLKKLRLENGLTQAQLAEKLYVSRSTIAKWENGLGLPNPESMMQLQALFGISAREMATEEPETVIVDKNRKLRLVGCILGWAAMLALIAVLSILPFAIHSGNYGFTAEMAAGSYADREYIDTGDYRIYYFIFSGEFEDGGSWSQLQGFRPVKNHLWGFTVSEEDYTPTVFTKNSYVVGNLYTIKGKNGYYHLLSKTGRYVVQESGASMVWDIPSELVTATSVIIGGTEYELQEGFFFITQEPVRYFKIGDEWYDVEE